MRDNGAMNTERTKGAAIVTGAARGIGAAAARRLAEDGFGVALTDVLDDEGEAVAKELAGDGLRVAYHHLEVTDEPAWASVLEAVESELGPVEVLVNNAGIGSMADVEQEERDAWDRVIAINQTGVWLGMKVVGSRMREHGRGSIINVSSIFGAVGGFGGSIAYHASKGAVRLMTKSAALRWATEGVRVNSLHPGFIETPLIAATKGTPMEEGIISMTPMGRLGRPEEISGVIAFLASDDASYMTGSEVYVDGGWIAR
jgi:NAD(P)-dependent dehydrogenase (short-subunit alcohol dehydrogenase family)